MKVLAVTRLGNWNGGRRELVGEGYVLASNKLRFHQPCKIPHLEFVWSALKLHRLRMLDTITPATYSLRRYLAHPLISSRDNGSVFGEDV